MRNMRNTVAPRERLIVALDVPGAADALAVADALGESVLFYKVGLELFAAGEGRAAMDALLSRGKRVFADLKLFDVPETVARATAQVSDSGADFLTVHGNDAMMAAAAAAKGDRLKILAVTALTSLDAGDLRDMGFGCDPAELALSRARRALELGCDGVVSSGLEVAALRRGVSEKESGDGKDSGGTGKDSGSGGKLIVVVPGVRPVDNRPEDDQKRVVSPSDAIRFGADYIVMGRPIRSAADPRSAAEAVQEEIASALH